MTGFLDDDDKQFVKMMLGLVLIVWTFCSVIMLIGATVWAMRGML